MVRLCRRCERDNAGQHLAVDIRDTGHQSMCSRSVQGCCRIDCDNFLGRIQGDCTSNWRLSVIQQGDLIDHARNQGIVVGQGQVGSLADSGGIIHRNTRRKRKGGWSCGSRNLYLAEPAGCREVRGIFISEFPLHTLSGNAIIECVGGLDRFTSQFRFFRSGLVFLGFSALFRS